MTREEWLTKIKEKLEQLFFNAPPHKLPSKLALSCGIPKGSSKAIGQCWDPRVSKDKTTHIFVCPSLDDPVQVVGVLLHELIHACLGLHEGHGKNFAKFIRKVGLVGKVTSTYVKEGSELESQIKQILEEVGGYPHQAMNKQGALRAKRQPVKRRVTLVSTVDPDYALSISIKVLEGLGAPKDPWDKTMVIKE